MVQQNNITVKERMDKIETALDDYEKQIGLPSPTNPGDESELQQYFSMSRDEIEALSSNDCEAIAYRLSQYALYIQRMHNRESSRLSWVKATMSEAIAKDYNNYSKYIKHEIKIDLIGKENEFVKKIQSISNYAQQRLDRLNFLSNNIKYLS